MTLTLDEYAITVPHRPGVIHSVSPTFQIHDLSFGALYGSFSFDSFHLEAVGDANEKTVIAGVANNQ